MNKCYLYGVFFKEDIMIDKKIVEEIRHEENVTGFYNSQNNFIFHSINDQPSRILKCGDKQWHKNGILHRENGPAFVRDNGIDMSWHIDGEIHREDGPAKIYHEGGSKRWMRNGFLHREDGPAIVIQNHPTKDKDGPLIQYHLEGCSEKVPEIAILDPQNQTIQGILDIENIEVKRCCIERFGWNLFLEKSNAKVLDEQQNDIEQTYEFLSKADDFVVFVGACPSTGRIYFMEVPEETKTCNEAKKYLSRKKSSSCIGAS